MKIGITGAAKNLKFKKTLKKVGEIKISKGKYKIASLKDLLTDYDVELANPIILEGYPTNYFVTSFGRVFTIHNDKLHFMKLQKDKHGYIRVQISFKDENENYHLVNIMLHRLVAMSFIDNPNNLDEVNHLDGDKENNFVWNLEWCTHSENMLHAYRTGLNHSGEKNSQSIYTEKQIHQVCKLLQANKLPKPKISEETGVAIYTIDKILQGKKWRAVSKDYDLSKYDRKSINTGSTPKYTVDQIEQVCKLLEENNNTMIEISQITGVRFYTIADIKRKRTWTRISNKYNF